MLTERCARAQDRRRMPRIGDRARFPLRKLGNAETYRHPWEVVAFYPDGWTMQIRRLADGITRIIGLHWWATYAAT